MSDLGSPTTAMAHVSRAAGLDQTPLDDYAPSSPDAEQFRAHRITTPSLLTGQTNNVAPSVESRTSPAMSSGTASARANASTTTPAAQTMQGTPGFSSCGSRTSLGSHQTHLSPTAEYGSEGVMAEFSHQTTPSFEDDMLFTSVFGNMMPPFSDFDHTPLLQPQPPPIDTTAAAAAAASVSASTGEAGPSDRSASTQRPPQITPTDSYPLSPVNTGTPSPPTERQQQWGEKMLTDAPGATIDKHGPSRDAATDLPPLSLPGAQADSTLVWTSQTIDVGPEDPSMNNPNLSPPYATSPTIKIESESPFAIPMRPGASNQGSRKRNQPDQPSPTHLSPPIDAFGPPPTQDFGGARWSLPAAPAAMRADDGSWLPSATTGQAGMGPDQRESLQDVEVPTLKEMEQERELKEKNADVELWIVESATPSIAGDLAIHTPPAAARRPPASGGRARAHTTGGGFFPAPDPLRLDVGGSGIDDTGIPGPGVLVYEPSDDGLGYASSIGDGSESPPASLHSDAEEEVTFPIAESPAVADVELGPRGFVPAHPWMDAPSTRGGLDTQFQPSNSNAAIMRFNRRAENLETASRMATWGTRRMSDSEVEKFVQNVKRLSIGRDKDKHKDKDKNKPKADKKTFAEVKRMLSKKAAHTLKRKGSEKSPSEPEEEGLVDQARADSLPTVVLSRQISNSSRPGKTNAGTAFAVALASQAAAVGSSVSLNTTAPSPPTPWEQAKNVLRSRSRSDVSRKTDINQQDPSTLAGMMYQHGGPPVTTLGGPPSPREKQAARFDPVRHEEDDDHDDDDEAMEDEGVQMDLGVRPGPVEATLEGFRDHVRQLNPRLVDYLVERISQEQMRRFKKLTDLRNKHAATVRRGQCLAGKFCFQLGGDATLLPIKASARETGAMTGTGFQVAGAPWPGPDASHEVRREGAVTSAQFPPGVPRPPVSRLPAEFECPLCFRVKKLQKPSDWTKHVHEDIQPFTCTFPHCAEPKSFKRKADWVRHENERHRQLEWWTCNLPDCSHTCFRRDNFVQHLVREHKKPEPRFKNCKAPSGSPAGQGVRASVSRDLSPSEMDQVGRLVRECRHETKKSPREEPCKFCGNILGSWKKLTVHLARHLQQISLPVLQLLEKQFEDEHGMGSVSNQPHQQQQQQQQQQQPSLRTSTLFTSTAGSLPMQASLSGMTLSSSPHGISASSTPPQASGIPPSGAGYGVPRGGNSYPSLPGYAGPRPSYGHGLHPAPSFTSQTPSPLYPLRPPPPVPVVPSSNTTYANSPADPSAFDIFGDPTVATTLNPYASHTSNANYPNGATLPSMTNYNGMNAQPSVQVPVTSQPSYGSINGGFSAPRTLPSSSGGHLPQPHYVQVPPLVENQYPYQEMKDLRYAPNNANGTTITTTTTTQPPTTTYLGSHMNFHYQPS
ncbi:MAG: oligosaccharyl transferase stt3 subunit [Watsoniomyces obsoletus]|nr:MAG: oligosaccharyl transferase stt3 subunit [Watsoniomyces obsoletus]